ncbi:MAG: SgcJ/EcaC family oxidoreductase [Planctomycetes bacterium]|nr:SgcJ/EcaC family oxidoreductase [Planctomycetota bacterium]
MKPAPRLACVAVVLSGLIPPLSCCTAAPEFETTALVASLSDEFVENWNAGNAEGIANLFAEDSVRVVSTQQLPLVGREAIQAAMQQGMEAFRTSSSTELISNIDGVREFDGSIVLADGTFVLNGEDGNATIAGKWSTVYRKTEEGDLEIVMESAHVQRDSLAEPIDYASIERMAIPAAIDLGEGAESTEGMQAIINQYTAGVKQNNASMIAGTFTEDGIQLVGSASKAHRGRAAIEAAQSTDLEAEGFAGVTLTATILRQRKLSDSIIAANGVWQAATEDGTIMEFGQWGNLMQIQGDGSLLMLLESAGGFTGTAE